MDNQPESGLDFDGMSRRELLRFGAVFATTALLAACGGKTLETATAPSSSAAPTTRTPAVRLPAVSTTAPRTTTPEVPSAPAPDFAIDFSREPAGALNPARWNFEEGTEAADDNQEAQAYTSRPENVRVEGGKLLIQAHPEIYGGRKYTSARITTQGKFDFQYGSLVVRAKMPKGVGTWPAIWLLPSHPVFTANATDAQFNNPDDPYFYAKDGEIDMAEAYGNRPGYVEATVNTYNNLKAGHPAGGSITLPDLSGAFHDYELDWRPGIMTFRVDGKPYLVAKKPSDNPDDWPYDKEKYHLILNLALGGTGGGDVIDPAQAANWRLEIASITHTPLAK